MESKFSGLAIDLGISKKSARRLVREYFDYYKNVERISIYEYVDRSLNNGDSKLSQK
jgi:DNA polymerase I-like protein with 3'-5' exonuclease and polymerase domains